MTEPRRISSPLAFIFLTALAGCGARHGPEKPDATGGPKPVTVTVVPVVSRAVERTVEVVGSLKGFEEVTVGAKRSGRVAQVYHDIGDRVAPGEPIVALDAIDSDLAVAQAERSLRAQLEQIGLKDVPTATFDESKVPAVLQARYVLEKATNNLNRERALRQRGAGTSQDFQNAEIDERSASAALDNARLTAQTSLANALVSKVMLEVARYQRAETVVRAPKPTRKPATEAPIVYAITKRSASEGQMLKDGDAVADLVIEDPLRLWTSVPERFSGEVRVGQDVRIIVPSHPGQGFAGKVARVNPAVDPSSRTFQVETAVPNPKGALRPGGFAKASIVVDQAGSATTVPLEAVVRSTGVTKVFVVAEGDKARAVPVTTGLEGKGWVEIVGPIRAGARVVATGQSTLANLNELADDTPLVVRTPDAPKAPTEDRPG